MSIPKLNLANVKPEVIEKLKAYLEDSSLLQEIAAEKQKLAMLVAEFAGEIHQGQLWVCKCMCNLADGQVFSPEMASAFEGAKRKSAQVRAVPVQSSPHFASVRAYAAVASSMFSISLADVTDKGEHVLVTSEPSEDMVEVLRVKTNQVCSVPLVMLVEAFEKVGDV